MSIRVYRSIEEARAHRRPSAVSIGNFDGVHLGHQELFRRLRTAAAVNEWVPAALTFDPHPAAVLAPERAPRLMSTLDERIRWMEQSGLDCAVVLPFTHAFAAQPPEEFVRSVLVDALDAKLVAVGSNFHFGCGQSGGVQTLAALGATAGFAAEIVDGVSWRGTPVSSTAIRTRIQQGQVASAARLLTRPYGLTGNVVSGHGVGKKETVPTLNLDTAAEVLPAVGVYVTQVHDLDAHRLWPAVSNVGFRPTFGGDRLSIESYLLEPPGDVPPRRIRVDFLHRLRDERLFSDSAALKAQILRDVKRAQNYHRRLRKWVR
jgi:riboflavin kinase/FMN adenylyltransferase